MSEIVGCFERSAEKSCERNKKIKAHEWKEIGSSLLPMGLRPHDRDADLLRLWSRLYLFSSFGANKVTQLHP